jgi:Fur family iron response transcriptional regulator
MTMADVEQLLRAHGIQPSAQRIAVGRYVLTTDDHPSADEVWQRVRSKLAVLSRATVYNTLNLFVARGLLRSHFLAEGRVVYDPRTEPHHHFIDDDSGRIHDVPWSALKVTSPGALPGALAGYDVREYQVVLRGAKKKPRG